MNLHPLAIDMLIDFRDEAKRWRQEDAGNGHSYIRRTEPLELSAATPPGDSVQERLEVVQTVMATDFIMLESLSYALRKHGVAE